MFFKKKNKVEPEAVPQVCNTDKNLTECEIVSNLKQYQKELKEIEMSNIENIITRYFKSRFMGIGSSTLFYIRETINDLIRNDEEYNQQYKNFEERFRMFGKEIDDYLQKTKIMKELNDKIKQEKDKLGIE
jgi:vacuolar-type H+-ATPase subunit I/STV1